MKRTYENKEICSTCGGHCCERLPGCLMPSDLGLVTEKKIRTLLASGNYCVDSWTGDVRPGMDIWDDSFFLRPAIRGREFKPVDLSWGGCCTFLLTNGCKLLLQDRPAGCQQLEPKRGQGTCVVHGAGKREAARAWAKWHELFTVILEDTQT